MTVITSSGTPPISLLPAVTSLDGTEMVPLVQGGTTKRGTSQLIANLVTNTNTNTITNVTGSFDWINVKTDFGAKGDGTTDDTTAIQNALNAAIVSSHTSGAIVTGQHTIYFPSGDYIITSPLTINGGNGIIIRGAGTLSTRIKNTNTSNGSVFKTNGFQRSLVTDMYLQAATNNISPYSTLRNVWVQIAQATDPFGGSNADQIFDTTDGTNGHYYSVSVPGKTSSSLVHATAGTNYCFSIYAKYVDRKQISIEFGDASGNNEMQVWWDLSTGLEVGNEGNIGGWVTTGKGITSIGSGWYRIYCAGHFTATRDLYASVFMLDDTSNSSYTGSFKSFYVYGPQLDVGVSTPNAYVTPTYSSCAFDLDADQTYSSVQFVTFRNVFFGFGDYGLRVDQSTSVQGNNVELINCEVKSNARYGIYVPTANAVECSIYGADIASNYIGIYVTLGCFNVISGCSFEANNAWDIYLNVGINDHVSITGCRSESPNFVFSSDYGVVITACKHTGTSRGYFLNGFQLALIDGCSSIKGSIYAPNVENQIRNYECGLDSAFSNTNARVEKCYIGKTKNNNGTGTQTYLSDGVVSYDYDGSGSQFYQTGSLRVRSLTDAANIVTDPIAKATTSFSVTLAGNRTLNNPTNLFPGTTYTWIITQGAGGSHTLAYDTAFTFPGGAPTLSIAAGAVDVITAVYDGSKLRANLTKAYS